MTSLNLKEFTEFFSLPSAIGIRKVKYRDYVEKVKQEALDNPSLLYEGEDIYDLTLHIHVVSEIIKEITSLDGKSNPELENEEEIKARIATYEFLQKFTNILGSLSDDLEEQTYQTLQFYRDELKNL